MFLSKSPHGVYYLYYKKPDGKAAKVSTRTKKKSEAKLFLESFSIPEKIPAPQKVSLRLSDIKPSVMQYARSNFSKSNIDKYDLTFRNMERIIGNKFIDDITVLDIENYKSERIKEVKKISCNIEIKVIKAIFNLCVKFELINNNRLSKISKFKIEEKEILAFSDNEISIIFNSIMDENLKRIVEFALLTGCRISEILSIRFKDIDLENCELNITNREDFRTKSKKNRIIPISESLQLLIDSILKKDKNVINFYNQEEYIFTFNGRKFDRSTVTRKFKKVLREAGLPEKYHFHCLRHTFITTLIKRGISINYVKELAGHADINTTMNYVHITTNDLRNAVNKIRII